MAAGHRTGKYSTTMPPPADGQAHQPSGGEEVEIADRHVMMLPSLYTSKAVSLKLKRPFFHRLIVLHVSLLVTSIWYVAPNNHAVATVVITAPIWHQA